MLRRFFFFLFSTLLSLCISFTPSSFAILASSQFRLKCHLLLHLTFFLVFSFTLSCFVLSILLILSVSSFNFNFFFFSSVYHVKHCELHPNTLPLDVRAKNYGSTFRSVREGDFFVYLFSGKNAREVSKRLRRNSSFVFALT
jgi:hypothetical protein